MKFNFRKIASVLASTVMLSSTVALAAAANYPTPFVKSGVADVAVVYGTNAANTDLVAATDITTNLNSKLVVAGASTSVSGGDFVQLEKSSNKFNLGENMSNFWTNLGSDQLSKVLADGVYSNNANNEFDYTQKITLTNIPLTFFQDNDFNDAKPIVGFDISSGQTIMNYTLEFTPDLAEGGTSFGDLETTDLTMLGRTYYVVQASNVAGAGVKLTLLDSANSAIVSEGATSSVTVNGASYDVGINFIDSSNVILTVNGVTTNKLSEGDVFKVGTDLYVGVKNILYASKESGTSKVEISIGSGKIVLENGNEVQVNNKDVSQSSDSILNAYITNSSTDISKIILEWKADNDMWLAPGTDLILPGFETIKFSMGGFITPAMEDTSVKNDGSTSLKLSTSLVGGSVSINLLYNNDTTFLGLGKAADKGLITNGTTSPTLVLDRDTEQYFVASWSDGGDTAESHYFRYTGIGSDATKNTTTFEDVATGSTYDINVGDNKDIGEVKLTLNSAIKSTNVISVGITPAGGSGTAYADRIFTAQGLKIKLPVNSSTVADGTFNATVLPTSFRLNFTEEDVNNNIGSGLSFTSTATPSSNGPSLGATASGALLPTTEVSQTDGSDVKVSMINSALASMVTHDTSPDADTLDITYHGDESYGQVYVSEVGAALVSEGSVNILPVKDSETTSAKNMVVVGGSCVNSVAAELLGGALCGADFEAKTGVGAGSFLIETFARDGGAVATLVAGYDAGDTTNAAKYLTTQTVDTTVGKTYKGTSATAATLVVA